MNRPFQRYHSYLLRIWPETNALAVQWRASLTSVDTNERLGFPSLEAAFLYLRGEAKGWEQKEDESPGDGANPSSPLPPE